MSERNGIMSELRQKYVKIEQYVRDIDGLIAKVEEITTKKRYAWCWSHYDRIDILEPLEEGHIGYVETNKKDGRFSVSVYFEDIVCIKNTPQELIKVKDLIRLEGSNLFEVLDTTEDSFRINTEVQTWFKKSEAVEIWTSAEIDTYKCQWRKQNE